MAICCNFCSKPKRKTRRMFAGPEDVYICEQCVELCIYELAKTGVPLSSAKLDMKVEDTKKAPKRKVATSTEEQPAEKRLTPAEIKAKLDETVVGQDLAKEVLSVAIYNHYKRLDNQADESVTTKIQKSNIMFIGNTGTGKTLLASSVAQLLDVPFVSIDSTTITESGYIGADVESICQRLIIAANYDILKAERGIVFIDEIDKKFASSGGGRVRDVSGEGVQHALLRLVEGARMQVTVPNPSDRTEALHVEFDTTNILFICGGAFVGLDKIIQARVNVGPKIGIGATIAPEQIASVGIELVEPDDLCKFGMINEFVGRFPVIVTFKDITEEMMLKIMKEPKNSIIDQFVCLFKMDDVDLEFSDEYLRFLARNSIDRKIGARGLRAVFEKLLTPVQYKLNELKSQGLTKVIIQGDGTMQYVNKKVTKRRAAKVQPASKKKAGQKSKV